MNRLIRIKKQFADISEKFIANRLSNKSSVELLSS